MVSVALLHIESDIFPERSGRGLTLMPTYAYSLAASIKRLACNTLISLVGRVGLEPTTY